MLLALRSERWTVVQVLPIGGQNDAKAEALLPSKLICRSYRARWCWHLTHGLTVHRSQSASFVIVEQTRPAHCFSAAAKPHIKVSYYQPSTEGDVESLGAT